MEGVMMINLPAM